MDMEREIGHLRDIMNERDRRYEQRYEASQRALEAALEAADRAVHTALLTAKEAVQKAELAADKRFELLNELRIGVATTDQLEALEKIITDLSKRLDITAGRSAGIGALVGWIVGGIGVVATFSRPQVRLLLALDAGDGTLTKRAATRAMWPDHPGPLTASMRVS